MMKVLEISQMRLVLRVIFVLFFCNLIFRILLPEDMNEISSIFDVENINNYKVLNKDVLI